MSLLLSALFSVASNIFWLAIFVACGPSMCRDAMASARRKDLKGLAWHGLPAVGLAVLGAISFVTLVGTLLIGALVVEQGLAQ